MFELKKKNTEGQEDEVLEDVVVDLGTLGCEAFAEIRDKIEI